MINRACTNHVQINVYQTVMQVLIRFDRGSVITVFPKRAMSVLALIVFLRRPAGDQLHALGYDIPACVFNKRWT
jgi:hypothetical protein